ncbi:MAG: response regulator [Rhodospirillaceae bacterium]|nr:response regulator [Rhodospirillaceae bacterium]
MANILVVEDMAGVQLAISSMLRRAGHTVVIAANGEQGIAQLKQATFELVITDMLMPGVDGTEVLVGVLAMPNRPPVIAMSGGGAGVSAEAALLAAKVNADAFLQKPFEKADLLAVVDRLLAKSAA